jgi:hypothetical protein
MIHLLRKSHLVIKADWHTLTYAARHRGS